MQAIATKLGGSTFETLWLGLAFLVAATCFLPMFATLSDILGRKAMLLTALTFFIFGSFIAAVTGNFTGLLFGRTIQGIGGGGIYALSNLILSDLISDADRVKWSGFLGAS
jgi:MFS family permease